MRRDGAAREREVDAEEYRPRALKALDVHELLNVSIPPREMILEPILRRQALALMYGWRGCGKSWLSIGLAYAACSSGVFLRWRAEKPRRVLFVDGELPMAILQERVAAVVAAQESEPPEPSFLRFITPDAQDDPMPNLADPVGQLALDALIDEWGIELLVLDNLSTLTAAIAENEADAWGVVQSWLLRLRRRGITVLLVHHAGKAGAQRGTSRREDVLDTVIALRRPDDYSPAEGARVEVHLEKARGIYGDAAEPFEAKLEVVDGAAVWAMRSLEDVTFLRAVELYRDGLTVRQVAADLKASNGAAGRLRKRAESEGLL